MTYILGGISLFMFGCNAIAGTSFVGDRASAHNQYMAAVYLAMAIVCFVCY